MRFLLFLCMLAAAAAAAVVAAGADQGGEDDNEIKLGLPAKGEEDADEWRVLGKDEPMERGAHVRLNLATGERHVKIERPKEAEGKFDVMERVLYGLPQPDERLPTQEQKQKMTKEEYEAALEMIWQHRQQEVRKAMETMDDYGTNIKKHTAVLLNASVTETSDDLVHALLQLEDLVQDIDNALFFAKIGGLEICSNLVHHSHAEIQSLAAFVIGTAIKGQPELQAVVHELQTIDALLQVVDNSLQHALKDSDHAKVVSKSFYALSALLSGHEQSQELAKESTLMDNLLAFLHHEKKPDLDEKVFAKVLTIVYDIFTEWEAFSTHYPQYQQAFTDALKSLDLENTLLQAKLDEAVRALEQCKVE